MTFDEMAKTTGVYTTPDARCSAFLVVSGKDDDSENIVLWMFSHNCKFPTFRRIAVAQDCWKKCNFVKQCDSISIPELGR